MKKTSNKFIENNINAKSYFDILIRGTKFTTREKKDTIINGIHPALAPIVQLLILKGYSVKGATFEDDVACIDIDCDTRKYLSKVLHMQNDNFTYADICKYYRNGHHYPQIKKLLDEEIRIYSLFKSECNRVHYPVDTNISSDVSHDRDKQLVVISATHLELIRTFKSDDEEDELLYELQCDKYRLEILEYLFMFVKNLPDYHDECVDTKKNINIVFR